MPDKLYLKESVYADHNIRPIGYSMYTEKGIRAEFDLLLGGDIDTLRVRVIDVENRDTIYITPIYEDPDDNPSFSPFIVIGHKRQLLPGEVAWHRGQDRIWRAYDAKEFARAMSPIVPSVTIDNLVLLDTLSG